ncbi:three component ABC system middle component [Arthrobacter sp.]|uniref:three component ABC system middle component n=1 Tax=Arthrobacter sp. TaxID=1667 RepID=UPI003A92C602
MKPWTERPVEVRNLFNPAFCGLLLQRAIKGYEEVDPSGMPYSLTLLVLPLSLHSQARKKLDAHPKTRLLTILEKQQFLILGFDERARDLLPLAHEAFSVLASNHCIEVSTEGRIRSVPRRMRTAIDGSPESQECQKIAARLGKEFARIGDRATVYATLGVRP